MSWQSNRERPCKACGNPIGRSHRSVRYCWACVRLREKFRGAATQSSLSWAAVGRILDLFDHGNGAALAETVKNGGTLRVFVCKCGALYAGPNLRRCKACVEGGGDNDDAEWMRGKDRRRR